MSHKWVDLLSRAAWTLIQVGVADAVVAAIDWPVWAVAPVAFVLSAAKTWAVGKAKTQPAE